MSLVFGQIVVRECSVTWLSLWKRGKYALRSVFERCRLVTEPAQAVGSFSSRVWCANEEHAAPQCELWMRTDCNDLVLDG